MAGEVQREHRKRVRISAQMRVDDQRMDVVICNVSSRGLLLSAEYTPKRGSYIEVSRGGVVTVGRVVWTNNGRFGVRTSDKLDVAAMAHKPTATRCMSLDDSTPAAAAAPKIRTFGKAKVDHLHQAEKNSWIAARMQFAAIGASVALVAAFAALISYELLSGVSVAVAAGLR